MFKIGKKKVPTKDFTVRDLPKNRWELLWDVLKHNFWKMVPLNGLYMLFLLPAIVATGALLLYSFNLSHVDLFYPRYLPYIANPDIPQELKADPSTFFSMGVSFFDYFWGYLLVMTVCLTIAGPAKAGLYYVIRNISWNEHTFNSSDFWKALRANWKQGALYNLLTGVIYLCGYQGIFLYQNLFDQTQNNLYQYAKFLVVFVLCFILMMRMYVFPQMVTYTLKFKQIVKNSFIFTTLQFFPTALILVIPLALLFVLYSLNLILFFTFFYMLIGFAMMALFQMSFSNYVFDKYMNESIPEATLRKGMSPTK